MCPARWLHQWPNGIPTCIIFLCRVCTFLCCFPSDKAQVCRVTMSPRPTVFPGLEVLGVSVLPGCQESMCLWLWWRTESSGRVQGHRCDSSAGAGGLWGHEVSSAGLQCCPSALPASVSQIQDQYPNSTCHTPLCCQSGSPHPVSVLAACSLCIWSCSVPTWEGGVLLLCDKIINKEHGGSCPCADLDSQCFSCLEIEWMQNWIKECLLSGRRKEPWVRVLALYF